MAEPGLPAELAGPAMQADIAGFADAQQRLRGQFGEDAVFLQPPTFGYPAGTPIDPDTDRPYDPVIVPTASAQASAAVTVNVVFAGRGEAEEAVAVGFAERTRVMLIADIADRPLCEGAVSVLLRGGAYHVTAMRADGISAAQRWLTYARRGA
jgi:hypothetical protein